MPAAPCAFSRLTQALFAQTMMGFRDKVLAAGKRFNAIEPPVRIRAGAGNARREWLATLSLKADQDAAARGDRFRELRWKNRAWLTTAETIAG